MISRYYSCQDSSNWGRVFTSVRTLVAHGFRAAWYCTARCSCVAFMMANGPGVEGDLQATHYLLARAVEWLDHMGTQQQPPHEGSQQVQVGRAYPYNPIPGPSQELLSPFQSTGTAARATGTQQQLQVSNWVMRTPITPHRSILAFSNPMEQLLGLISSPAVSVGVIIVNCQLVLQNPRRKRSQCGSVRLYVWQMLGKQESLHLWKRLN